MYIFLSSYIYIVTLRYDMYCYLVSYVCDDIHTDIISLFYILFSVSLSLHRLMNLYEKVALCIWTYISEWATFKSSIAHSSLLDTSTLHISQVRLCIYFYNLDISIGIYFLICMWVWVVFLFASGSELLIIYICFYFFSYL